MELYATDLELCYNGEYRNKHTQEQFIQEAYFRVERLRTMIQCKG